MFTYLSERTARPATGINTSYWGNSVWPIKYDNLEEDLSVDIVVIGGGIAGSTIAYCLAQEGKKVALVDSGYIGNGETGRSMAHLIVTPDDSYSRLERTYGKGYARLTADSHMAAIDFIERVTRKETIECDFERLNGYLFLQADHQPAILKRELYAALNAGLEVKEMNTMPGIKQSEEYCLMFANQAQMHPLKYLKGLCEAIQSNGGRIFTETPVDEIVPGGLVTNFGLRIHAERIVIATNSPANNKYMRHLKQLSYRTYIIGAKVKKDSLPRALWWDTGNHHVRLLKYDREFDLLLCGGEDYSGRINENISISEEQRYQSLENWMRERFNAEDVIYKWRRCLSKPLDRFAYIHNNAEVDDHVYIVPGDPGNGLTHSTIAGIIVADLLS